MPRTRVKICGLRTEADALAAADAGADAVGFILVENTPRYIDPAEAVRIVGLLPPLVTPVGVTRDLTTDRFADLEQRCPLPLMQLHGDEPDKVVAACGPGVIKAVRFDNNTILAELRRWSRLPEVDAVLVDGPAPGSGQRFDWQALADAHAQVARPKPLILAGGLTPDNVADAIAAVRPYAVDVSSGVESAAGIKDHAKIAAFCTAVADAPSRA